MIIHIENKEFCLTDFLIFCESELKRSQYNDWKNFFGEFTPENLS